LTQKNLIHKLPSKGFWFHSGESRMTVAWDSSGPLLEFITQMAEQGKGFSVFCKRPY
jgi:hypothetical protein